MKHRFTSADLVKIKKRWETETLQEIADSYDTPIGTLKSLLHRQNIKCPRSNAQGSRRKFGPVTIEERDRNRRWYRMYHGMRTEGVSSKDAMSALKADGCTLKRHQITCGWWHYSKRAFNK
ncbi:MAG: hypothetical protein CMA63_06615 [Euryarchaeota archaeon]|nr:hypothetical protein [Euryarchaeota archaeon]